MTDQGTVHITISPKDLGELAQSPTGVEGCEDFARLKGVIGVLNVGSHA
jgi:hypothetical protein